MSTGCRGRQDSVKLQSRKRSKSNSEQDYRLQVIVQSPQGNIKASSAYREEARAARPAYQVTQTPVSTSEAPKSPRHDAMAGAIGASLWLGSGQRSRSSALLALVRARSISFPVNRSRTRAKVPGEEKQGEECTASLSSEAGNYDRLGYMTPRFPYGEGDGSYRSEAAFIRRELPARDSEEVQRVLDEGDGRLGSCASAS